MKINESSNTQKLLEIYRSELKQGKNLKAKKDTSTEEENSLLDISPEAREIQSFHQKLNNLSDVRQELIESIQQKIEDGSFEIDEEKIINGLSEEINSMKNQKR
ncbi:MAG TPA: flagellar biosynthesis anti-sigma factor FlgM [Desulfotomaculum sp.]|nr:MAG: Anti-sigma-28 factor, FlgM [Desulfotomaculum sp. 46_80]HAG11539.1 flagellar biosynthesis anti-sigma factor FlgM [Desulfotomaculum sp.]HBY03757.1 flagellar biosynthesis anti-sigma factor FlgM [Desulfotomaculum sp.]